MIPTLNNTENLIKNYPKCSKHYLEHKVSFPIINTELTENKQHSINKILSINK